MRQRFVRSDALVLACVTLLAAWPTLCGAHPPSIQSPAAEAATGEEVVDVLAKLQPRLARRDARDLERLYASGFSHVDAAGGQRGRAAHVAAIVAGEAVAEAAALDDRAIRSANGWVAVVTGIVPATGGHGASRATIVLTRAGTAWQIAATHVSSLAKNETTSASSAAPTGPRPKPK